MLHYDIASIYDDLENQPWIEVTNKGWYQQLIGQIHENGKPTDKYLYDFADSKGAYNIDITLAAKCNAKASCSIFPRAYQSSLEDKTIEFGFDPNDYTFMVGECKIQPEE